MDSRTCESRIDAARGGSAQALDDLLEQARQWLEPLAAAQLASSIRPKESASDLVQETLIQVAVGFPEFQGKTVGEFRSWLARILEHRAVDIARRFRCEKRDVSRETAGGSNIVNVVRASDVSPSEHVAQTEQQRRLIDFMETLSQQERRLLQFRYHDGLSFDEIAQRLGLPRETTRRTWYCLVEQLGRRLEGHHK